MSSPPADRRQRLQQLVENSEYVGVRPKRVTEQRTINPADPKIKQDIIRMILQYLQEEGYAASFVTIQDETNVKLAEQRTQRAQLKRMRKAILDGDWVEVEKMCSKASLPNYKAFLYAAHRAQYLELIEGGESQKAFTHLTKRLKPLESVAPSPSDFRDLCYLLTCKSVQEVVRDWEGAVPARERLVEQYNSMLDLEAAEGGGTPLPEQRLLRLLQQAVAYQMEFSHYHPRAAATQVSTLLEDYACPLLPNAQDSLLPGDAGVKCLEWIGTKPLLASSGNDHVVRLWNVQARTCVAALDAHTSRVWQVAAMPSGHSFASASADGTVCLWNTQEVLSDAAAMASGVALSVPPRLVLRAHAGDVHTCRFHPTDQQLLLSAGYDKTVRLCDVATGTTLRTMHGHLRSVSDATFNATGNLIASASKDGAIRFWDARSGLCLKTLAQHHGEVTSVQLSANGLQMLSAAKDNSVRLWDVRSSKALRVFKGHLNTSKNFVRASFGPGSELVTSGSEDGAIYIWDLETALLMQRLPGHSDVAYEAQWSAANCLLASCSGDGTVRTWCYDPSVRTYVG